MDESTAFVLAGLALAGSPGPATLSLAATGAAFGARAGLRYLSGIVAGMAAVIGVTVAGVTGLVFAVPGAKFVLAGLAALYFVYLAFRIATAPPLGKAGGRARPGNFTEGAALSLVNPKGYAAMASLFSGFVLDFGALGIAALLKPVMMVAIIIAVNLAWLHGGAALTRLFRDPALSRAVNVFFAVLLVASVAAAFAF